MRPSPLLFAIVLTSCAKRPAALPTPPEPTALELAWARLLAALPEPHPFAPVDQAALAPVDFARFHADVQAFAHLQGGTAHHVPVPGVRFLSSANLGEMLNPASVFAEEVDLHGAPVMVVEGYRMYVQSDGHVRYAVTTETETETGVIATTEMEDWQPNLAAGLDQFSTELESGEVVYVPELGASYFKDDVPPFRRLAEAVDEAELTRLAEALNRDLAANGTATLPGLGTLVQRTSGTSLKPEPAAGSGVAAAIRTVLAESEQDMAMVVWPGLGVFVPTQRRSFEGRVSPVVWHLRQN